MLRREAGVWKRAGLWRDGAADGPGPEANQRCERSKGTGVPSERRTPCCCSTCHPHCTHPTGITLAPAAAGSWCLIGLLRTQPNG